MNKFLKDAAVTLVNVVISALTMSLFDYFMLGFGVTFLGWIAISAIFRILTHNLIVAK